MLVIARTCKFFFFFYDKKNTAKHRQNLSENLVDNGRQINLSAGQLPKPQGQIYTEAAYQDDDTFLTVGHLRYFSEG